MMATTHALVGFCLGAVAIGFGLPDSLALSSAVLGSVAPDLDLYYGHRQTLHYPVLFPVAAAVAGILSLLLGGSVALLAVGLFLAAGAVHTWLDVLGGGLELRPWEGNSERAVYDHVSGTWIPPRRWVPYDGAPEDLALAGALAVIVAPFYGGVEQLLLTGLVGVSIAYVLLRRRLATLAPAVTRELPHTLRERVPARYRE